MQIPSYLKEIFEENDYLLKRKSACHRINLFQLQDYYLTKPNTVFLDSFLIGINHSRTFSVY